MRVGSEEWKNSIEDIEAFTDKLNSWEISFIDSLMNLKEGTILSDAQESKFSEIWEKATEV